MKDRLRTKILKTKKKYTKPNQNKTYKNKINKIFKLKYNNLIY